MYPVQISDDRFLVEFAPCEKGEFRETTYQETFVFDIVQTDDGRRHSIMKGDKVLAPTDIGSELYAPGTVIDGQERREQSKGGLYNIQHHTPHAQKKWFKISKFSVHVISIPDPYIGLAITYQNHSFLYKKCLQSHTRAVRFPNTITTAKNKLHTQNRL